MNAILFLYHKNDSLTKRNYQSFLDNNKDDEGSMIIDFFLI
jgi:hypothetical protein